jgi:hypothetical protein
MCLKMRLSDGLPMLSISSCFAPKDLLKKPELFNNVITDRAAIISKLIMIGYFKRWLRIN